MFIDVLSGSRRANADCSCLTEATGARVARQQCPPTGALSDKYCRLGNSAEANAAYVEQAPHVRAWPASARERGPRGDDSASSRWWCIGRGEPPSILISPPAMGSAYAQPMAGVALVMAVLTVIVQ